MRTMLVSETPIIGESLHLYYQKSLLTVSQTDAHSIQYTIVQNFSSYAKKLLGPYSTG